jgi:hypothetical protein
MIGECKVEREQKKMIIKKGKRITRKRITFFFSKDINKTKK